MPKELRIHQLTSLRLEENYNNPYQVELKLKSLYTEDFIFIKASGVDDIPACVSPVNMSQIKDIPV